MKLTRQQNDLLKKLRQSGEWLRPMDMGGFDGSHHSATLRQLWHKGLAERKPRHTLQNHLRGATKKHASSFVYKIGGDA